MDTRVGAYAVIVQEGAVLLSHWNPRHPTLRGAWSLPGGGMEIGEQPAQTALREVFEETGFAVELDELLGVHSRHMGPGERLDGRGRPFHALRVIYRAHITGGTLTAEVGGSSDEARWFPLEALAQLPLVSLVPVGLGLAGLAPAGLAAAGEER